MSDLVGDKKSNCKSSIFFFLTLGLRHLCISCTLKWVNNLFQSLYVFCAILESISGLEAALTRLKPVWNDRSISLSSKIRLMCSLVTSIFLYTCKSWTLTTELQRRIQAMEMRCYHKILCISHKVHITNEDVRAKIKQVFGPHDDLLTTVKRSRLQWYGHVSRSSGLAKTILQGTVKGGRRRSRQRKRWKDNIRKFNH